MADILKDKKNSISLELEKIKRNMKKTMTLAIATKNGVHKRVTSV